MRDGAVVQIGRPVDLKLNPAGNYVRDLTSDVPWEGVLRASDIVEKPSGPLKGMGRISVSALIGNMFRCLADHQEGVIVEEDDGTFLNTATARGVVSALQFQFLARPNEYCRLARF